MSKNSPKQAYLQLQEWLVTRNGAPSKSPKSTRRFSKTDHYKKRR